MISPECRRLASPGGPLGWVLLDELNLHPVAYRELLSESVRSVHKLDIPNMGILPATFRSRIKPVFGCAGLSLPTVSLMVFSTAADRLGGDDRVPHLAEA
jgi:hypothetical protein